MVVIQGKRHHCQDRRQGLIVAYVTGTFLEIPLRSEKGVLGQMRIPGRQTN